MLLINALETENPWQEQNEKCTILIEILTKKKNLKGIIFLLLFFFYGEISISIFFLSLSNSNMDI